MLIIVKSRLDCNVNCTLCNVTLIYDEYPPTGEWAVMSCPKCMTTPQDKKILIAVQKVVNTVNLIITASSVYKAFQVEKRSATR